MELQMDKKQSKTPQEIDKYTAIRDKSVEYMRSTGASARQLYILKSTCNMIINAMLRGE